MPDPVLTENQQKVANAFSATLKVDLYATTLNSWAELSAQDKKAVQPFMPTFPVHYELARKHARTWTESIRPALTGSVVAIQGLYDDFVSAASAKSKGALRRDMDILRDPGASEQAKTDALARLQDGLNGIFVDAQQILVGDATLGLLGARDVLSQLQQFAADASADLENLYADYQELENLTAELNDLKNELDDAQADLAKDKAAIVTQIVVVALGSLAFIGGIVLTVVGTATSVFTGGAAGVAVGVGLTLVGAGAGAIIGGAIELHAAIENKERDEKRVAQLDVKNNAEAAAVVGAGVLSGQAPFLAQNLQDVRESMGVLIDKYKDFPEELRHIRDDAAKAKSQSDFAQLDDDLTQLALDYGDLNTSLQSLLAMLTSLHVQVDGKARSFLRVAA